MCGRFTLTTSPQQVASLFADLDVDIPDFRPRYNIAPTQEILAVRQEESRYQAAPLRWGLIPFWAKDMAIGNRLINARSDTVAEKPSFRAAFKSRRCLILADGFYEWKAVNKRKQPYWIRLEDRQPFCFAGLWESWRDKQTNESVMSCTIITTDANDSIQQLHHRMPVIMEPADYAVWLDPEFKDFDVLKSKLAPRAAKDIVYSPVNPRVNNARNEGADCIEPAEA